MAERKRILLLFSGGIDSTACLQHYLDLDYNVDPIFIEYGQPALKNELKSSEQICDYYSLDLIRLKVDSQKVNYNGEIIGRNLMLLSQALMNVGSNNVIAIGIHKGTGYYDCSEDFTSLFSQMLKEYTDGTICLETPFINWDKKEIWNYSINKNVPIELTYSCEKGGEPRCGKCETCRDINELYGR